MYELQQSVPNSTIAQANTHPLFYIQIHLCVGYIGLYAKNTEKTQHCSECRQAPSMEMQTLCILTIFTLHRHMLEAYRKKNKQKLCKPVTFSNNHFHQSRLRDVLYNTILLAESYSSSRISLNVHMYSNIRLKKNVWYFQ